MEIRNEAAAAGATEGTLYSVHYNIIIVNTV